MSLKGIYQLKGQYVVTGKVTFINFFRCLKEEIGLIQKFNIVIINIGAQFIGTWLD